MDLFTRYRTILVMFAFMCFVSFLIIRYFYQPDHIKIIEDDIEMKQPAPNPIVDLTIANEPVSHWTSAFDYFCPYEKEGYEPGPEYVLENSINIPIWKDQESTKKIVKLRRRPRLVTWKELKKQTQYLNKDLQVGNMSFSFWLYFDETVSERPKTSIIQILNPNNPAIVPLSVCAIQNKPILEISYMANQKINSGENQLVSYESDLYGGNQVGYSHIPTLVFITIQNNIIRLVLNGVEQNKFGKDIIFEPGTNFVIGSGHTFPHGMDEPTGISIRDLRIYAEPVRSSTAKIIFDVEKKKIEGFSTIKTQENIFFESFKGGYNRFGGQTKIVSVPPPIAKVGMQDLQLKTMGEECNQNGDYYHTRNTHLVDKIVKNGNTDVTFLLKPLLNKPYSNFVAKRIFDIFSTFPPRPEVTKRRRQQPLKKRLMDFYLDISLTNDHGLKQAPYKITYSEPDDIRIFWETLISSIKNGNTTNMTPILCPAKEYCAFFTAGKQMGKCVAENPVPVRTNLSFKIMKSSENITRKVSFVDLNPLRNEHFTFKSNLGNKVGNGTTFSFWFTANPENFKNGPLNSNDRFYLLHCGDKTWDKTINDISISVNLNGDISFLLKEGNKTYSQEAPFAVLDNKPHHIAWVIGNGGNWRLYHNGKLITTVRKIRLPEKERQFNIVGGTPDLRLPFLGSIGEFKIFDERLGSGHIQYLYENAN